MLLNRCLMFSLSEYHLCSVIHLPYVCCEEMHSIFIVWFALGFYVFMNQFFFFFSSTMLDCCSVFQVIKLNLQWGETLYISNIVRSCHESKPNMWNCKVSTFFTFHIINCYGALSWHQLCYIFSYLLVFSMGNNAYGQCGRRIVEDEVYRCVHMHVANDY